jgi:hypothetical protein
MIALDPGSVVSRNTGDKADVIRWNEFLVKIAVTLIEDFALGSVLVSHFPLACSSHHIEP